MTVPSKLRTQRIEREGAPLARGARQRCWADPGIMHWRFVHPAQRGGDRPGQHMFGQSPIPEL